MEYALDDREIVVLFPSGAWCFSLPQGAHTSCEADPVSYSKGTVGSFPGDKAAEA